jgi:hypothetical protein
MVFENFKLLTGFDFDLDRLERSTMNRAVKEFIETNELPDLSAIYNKIAIKKMKRILRNKFPYLILDDVYNDGADIQIRLKNCSKQVINEIPTALPLDDYMITQDQWSEWIEYLHTYGSEYIDQDLGAIIIK